MALSIAIVGDGSVGKSSLINSIIANEFEKVYRQTIGCDFYEKSLELRLGQRWSLRIFDIGGQSIASQNLGYYLSSVDAVLCMYDLCNRESFENTGDWVSAVRKHCVKPNVSIYLVGNKVDQYDQRQVAAPQHEARIVEYRLSGGFFTSAKTGDSVMKQLVRVCGETLGLDLTEAELSCYDRVVAAHIQTGDGEGRTLMADAIEAEDRAIEERKRHDNNGCQCSLS